jgi:hypothetical protein
VVGTRNISRWTIVGFSWLLEVCWQKIRVEGKRHASEQKRVDGNANGLKEVSD